jgi:hypothetical protein
MSISSVDFLPDTSLHAQTAAGCVILNKWIDCSYAAFSGALNRNPLSEDVNDKPGRVAQLAEHSTLNRQVEGSIPSASTILVNNLHHRHH